MKQPTDYYPVTDETTMLPTEDMEALRFNAEQLRALGAASSQFAMEQLDGTVLVEHIVEDEMEKPQPTKEQLKEQTKVVYEAVTDFVDALPHTHRPGAPREHSARPYFGNWDLGELRLIESAIWWGNIGEIVDFEEYNAGYARSIGVHKSNDVISLADLKALTKPDQVMPFYQIGEYVMQTNRNQSNSQIELLLASASVDPAVAGIFKVSMSSIDKDRVEELSFARLAEPQSPEQAVENYEAYAKDGKMHYFLEKRKPRYFDNPILGSLKVHEGVPANPKAEAKFYEKLDKQLGKRGVRIGRISRVTLTPEMIQEYDVASHTFRLAALFGREDEHGAMLDTIEKAGQ